MGEVRKGEAFELGEQLTVLGSKLQIGQMVPEFMLDEYRDDSIGSVQLSESNGRVRLLSTVNSLDTPVCDIETRRFDALLDDLGGDTAVFTVSMDLPFAQARWRAGTTGHRLLSAHRSEKFGRDYGVLIKEWRLLQRAIFVIDRDGEISFAEYVADQMAEPDYDATVAAVRAVG